jgi:hypothetical protein
MLHELLIKHYVRNEYFLQLSQLLILITPFISD